MDQAPEDLKLRLKKLRVESTSHRRFVPALQLGVVLSETAIRQALLDAKVKSHAVDEATNHVLGHGLKVFGILVLIGQVAATLDFIKEGELQDHRLPFVEDTLRSLKLLPPVAIDDFVETQWEIIAPVFSRGAIHRSLRKNVVLPFIKEVRIGEGSFGTVYEIVLHPDHQELGCASQTKIVRKALAKAEDHRVELENLSILSHLRHPNIVELLASYTYKEEHNLIFPMAVGGTLEDLFGHDPEATAFKTKSSFFIAMAGLSSAIENVHNFTERRIEVEMMGCHYDLRPKNILVSEDRMILADFGLSRFKDLSEDSATTYETGALDYQAPECEDLDSLQFQKHLIRRSSDIWSFGCVLAEIITYMLCGSVGVQEFRKARRFRIGHGIYRYFHRGPNQPNEAVDDWLSQLPLGSSAASKVLIDLIWKMLSPDEKKRPRAKQVTGSLRLIALREVSDPVKQLFGVYLREKPSSFDALIEHTKFHSWQYTLGLLEQQCATDLAMKASAWHLSEFISILDTLRDFHKDLATYPSHHPNVATVSLYHLSELNYRLEQILDDDLQKNYRLYFKAFILQNKGEATLQHIQDMRSSMHLPSEVKLRAALKHMTQLAMWHNERDTFHLQLATSSIKIEKHSEERSTGTLLQDGVNLPVLVEWREYGRQSADEIVQHELFARTDAIAELLSQEKPREFCALDCKGFFPHVNKLVFGLVFSYPQPDSPRQDTSEPQCLHQLLERTSKYGKLHPTLDDRFWIAHKLCRSVLEFHLVGWLHKRVSSTNMLFFPTSEHLDDDWVRTPYIVGFSHSRPDEISAYTEGPAASRANCYQHPSYFVKRRYCAEYDYYSVGVVLLEIGFWKPLGLMMQKHQGSYEQLRQYLLQKWLPLLKQSMGRSYYHAVKWCLEIDSNGSELERDPQASEANSLHLDFDAMVVQRLARLSNIS